MTTLLSVGHGTADRTALTELFRRADAGLVVDVRRYPGSRRNPDVFSDAMAEWLPEAGIAYRWAPDLGGRRSVPEGRQDADPWWRVEAFRGYAAYTRTGEFRTALDDLVARAAATAPRTTLFLCSESVWWRCHRRLISDALVLVRGLGVEHLAHDGRRTPHVPAAGARVTPEGLRYDAAPAAP